MLADNRGRRTCAATAGRPDSAHRRAQAAEVRLRNANVGNQCTVTGRLVVFTMVGQEPLRCPGPAWAAGAARW
jgi:hypothetical protein